MKKQAFGVLVVLLVFVGLLTVGTRTADAYAATDLCAILYEDGTLVFQYGDTSDGRAVKKTYLVDWMNVQQPWSEECEAIHVVSFADKVSPTSTAKWFYKCSNLERVDNIQNLDTANVTDMTWMFCGCSGLTALDVSHFDTANVTNMHGMFSGCSGLAMLDVSHFDTANVTSMEGMFADCSGLTALDVSHFDTANVTNMHGMFQNCDGLTVLDVSHFDTANVTDMMWMFCVCKSLTVLDVSHFDTANVTNMLGMFTGCSALTALDVSHFDTANVTGMSSMFSGCSSLTKLDLSSFNTAKVTNVSTMFIGCSGLTALDLSSFNTVNVTDMSYMFDGCSELTALDISHFDTANVKNVKNMFSGCSKLNTICASNKFTTASVTENGWSSSSADMFKNCTSLMGGNGTKFDASHTNKEYARIDGGASAPGYFTAKGAAPVAYAITAAVPENGKLSVALSNPGAATLAAAYYDANGKFVSVELQSVGANAGTVALGLSAGAKTARVMLLGDGFRPLCKAFEKAL
ncbi:MAG: BspA family leucine-rich repeat surface protein [Oscillibacter sp.]|nr:BspA family leucine-rich repeat surface protein [Oscillibacter sp.]